MSADQSEVVCGGPGSDESPGLYLEVVLRGGKPWGFILSGGSETGLPLYIAAIDPGGKAYDLLKLNDNLLAVNDIPVSYHQEAVQIIRSAFTTLTLAVTRGQSSSAAQPAANQQAPVFIRRYDTPDRTQDDTAIYESKAKEGAARRPKRRGASFNLRSPSDRPTPWQRPPSDSDSPSIQRTHYVTRHASLSSADFAADRMDVGEQYRGSEARSSNSLTGDGRSNIRQRMMPSTTSTPSFQYYGQLDERMDTALPPGVVPPSQSFHSIPVIPGGDVDSLEQPYMKRSFSYGESKGLAHWNKLGPQPFRKTYQNDLENKENQPSRGRSEVDIRHGYSASYSGSVPSSGSRTYTPHQSQNYVNIEMIDSRPGYSSESSDYKDSTRSEYTMDSSRSISPPVPPVRDPSSLKYIRVNQNHEKYPSWPVTQTQVSHHNTSLDISSTPGFNSRTNSWSDTTHTNTEFPSKPRMAYHPVQNKSSDERMSPKTMRRYLQENKIRTKKDIFNDRVATELKGEDLDIKRRFPLDAKGKIDINGMKGSDPSYPLPNVDKDGRYMEDKNYAIPSPPQRDGSPMRYDGWSSSIYSPSENHPYSKSSMDYMHPQHKRESSPPPPLPDNSPPQPLPPNHSFGSESSMMDSSTQSANSSQNRSSYSHTQPNKASPQASNYPYIIRQRVLYNTSTQTDTKNVEIQVGEDFSLSKARARREEKSCQARPGSIVGHQKRLENNNDSDYERLIFHREGDNGNTGAFVSTGTGTNDIAISPGPFSPRDNRPPPAADRLNHSHRIPETISENEEAMTTGHPDSKRYNSERQFTEDVIAEIQGHSEDDTVMLRRLSQDFFRTQGNRGVPVTNRLSTGSNRSSSSRSSMDGSSHSRQGSTSNETLPPRELPQPPRDLPKNSWGPGWRETSGKDTVSMDMETTESEDRLEALPLTPKDHISAFDRNKSANMSLRKAYGICEDLEGFDSDLSKRKFSRHAKSASSSQVLDSIPRTSHRDETVPSKKSSKKKKSPDKESIRETKIIAENARKEYERSGKVKYPDMGRLKRTTSEQIRPMKERLGNQDQLTIDTQTTDKHKLSDPNSSQQDKKHKTSDPSQYDLEVVGHMKRSSDSDAQKAEDFLCNSPLSRERRMASDSDNVFSSVGNHTRQSSSNRSTNSTEDATHSRNSDPELKRYQQQAVLGFFEKKANKHLSSSSTESSHVDTGKDQSSPGWRRTYSPQHSPSRFRKSQSTSLPRDSSPAYEGLPTSSHENSQRNAVDQDRVRRISSEQDRSKNDKRISLEIREEDFMSSDSSRETPKVTEEYINWKANVDRRRSDSFPLDPVSERPRSDTYVAETKSSRPTDLDETIRMRGSSLTEEETHPKAIEASLSANSSASPGLASPSLPPQPHEDINQRYSYQITANKTYSNHDDDEKPPVLPPRNYRGNERSKNRPPPPPVTSQNVTKVNVMFSSDYDVTPKADSYADQLRQQSRRISQSSSLLSAARFQNKAVSDPKTSISVSRPVDKPPSPQEAKVPSPGYKGPEMRDTSYSSMSEGNSYIENSFSPSSVSNISNLSTGDVGNVRATTTAPLQDSIQSFNVRATHNSSSSFDSTFPGPSPVTSVSHSRTMSSPAVDNKVEILKTQRDTSVPTQTKKSTKTKTKTKPKKPKQPKDPQNDLTPPTPPPKNISPPSRLEDKPLPPPPDELNDSNNNGDISNDTTPERYTSESYMYNRVTTRQGFGGNYRRSGETTPTKPPSPSGHNLPLYARDSAELHLTTDYHTPTDMQSVSLPNPDQGTPLRTHNKSYGDSAWGKRTYYPASTSPKSSDDTSPNTSAGQISRINNFSHPSPVSPATNGESEDVQSPSVRECIKNFENWSPRTQRKQTAISRGKVGELRENLLRRSNEDLSETKLPYQQVRDRHRNHDQDSLSSRSRSNESLDERLSTETKSTENLNKTTPSPHRDTINYTQKARKSPEPSPIGISERKPMSPTLESGYNSHTPDNRSIVSELSLSSAGSGSISNPSRNSSNVSKDSVDITQSLGQSVTVVHVRQKSMEEIECEKQAALLVSQLPDSEKSKLQEVILPPPQHKTTTDYMAGLFDTHVDNNRRHSAGKSGHSNQNSIDSSQGNHSNQTSIDYNGQDDSITGVDLELPVSSAYWSPPSIAQLQNKMRLERINTEDLLKNVGSGISLDSQKAELVARIEKKLQILHDERETLEEEVADNNNIGKQLSSQIETKVSNIHDYNKYKIYLDELDTVLKLLLKVSGQLARAENAIMSLTDGATDKERVALKAKRDDLSQKHEDAKQLKENIDMRSQQVAASLKKCLSPEQFQDYEYFIKMKSKLKMEQQEIDDKISLGEEQLQALRKTLRS